MRTGGGHGVKRAVRVAVNAVFFAVVLYDPAVPRGNVFRRFFPRHEKPATDPADGVACALHQRGGGGEKARGRVHLGIRGVIAEDPGSEDRGGGHGVRHAPFSEAGGNMKKRHGRGVEPDIGDAVERHAVLRGPGIDLLRLREPEPCLTAQTLVAVAEVFSAAVAAAPEKQKLAALPQAPAVAARVKIHALQLRRVYKGEEIRTLLVHSQGIETAPIQHGEVRRDDDMVRRYAAAVAAHRMTADITRRRVLIDREPGQKRRKELKRVKPRLLLKADGFAHRKGKLGGNAQTRRSAEIGGICHLALQ